MDPPQIACEQLRPLRQTLIGSAASAAIAGAAQMLCGGIVLDGISTRLQGGFSLGQALWGIRGRNNSVGDVVARFSRVTGHSSLYTRAALLRRSNLYAGVRVVIAGRFPYLFTNFATYAKTEAWIMKGKNRMKNLGVCMWRRDIVFCVSSWRRGVVRVCFVSKSSTS